MSASPDMGSRAGTWYRTALRITIALPIAALASATVDAQAMLPRIPLTQGLTLVSVLRVPDGDRENVVTVEASTSAGVTYTWHASARTSSGERTEATFNRYVRAADLAGATRLNTVFWSEDRTAYPGYTAFSISTAVYERLRASGEVPFTVTELDNSGSIDGLVGGGFLRNNLKLKGTLSAVATEPEPFPLIVNGRRVTVPALRVHGRFALGERRLEQDFWILADSRHPLILKTVTGKDALQTVRVEVPGDAVGQAAITSVEQALDKECRAELPGIYFAFGTADLDRASDRTLEGIAQVLARHSDWKVSIEGHTDSVGSAAANQQLSLARAEAVRINLTVNHGINAQRLRASGYGASRPRESNSTLEGRARNRRVELVRPCAPAFQGERS